jgi:hypothetical protein
MGMKDVHGEVYRVTREGMIREKIKIGTRTSVLAQIGTWKSMALSAARRGRQPSYRIVKIERAPVSAFEDVTHIFQDSMKIDGV